MSDSTLRAQDIRWSLRAFVCGLIGLIPVWGAPVALFAIVCWIKVIGRRKRGWNPASVYLYLGVAFGMIGLALTFAAVLLILLRVADNLMLF